MRSIRRARRERHRVSADINITNLVDLAFVLLIIFIITAPVLQGGIELELPEAEAQPVENQEMIIVSINRDGGIFVNDSIPVGMDELRDIISAYRGDTRKPVAVKADANGTVEPLTQVLGILSGMGITEIVLPVTPIPDERSD